MRQHIETNFAGEYLRELRIARHQLMALSESVPASSYSWKPVPEARTFSAILVHIAVGSAGLLWSAGLQAPMATRLYAGLGTQDATEAMLGMIRRNVELERGMNSKPEVIELLAALFDEVEQAILPADDAQLQRELPAFRGRADGFFFADETTVRRLLLRILTHTHEHMGQAIAYVRMMGLKAPWPDPLAGLVGSAAAN